MVRGSERRVARFATSAGRFRASRSLRRPRLAHALSARHRHPPPHPASCRSANGEVRDAIHALAGADHSFVTTRQNIAEFWNVCTRPAIARGGIGLSAEEASHRLRIIERIITVLGEPASANTRWKILVRKHKVLGRQVHDARIAATMTAHRVKRILTLNDSDFVRFAPELSAHTPAGVLGR